MAAAPVPPRRPPQHESKMAGVGGGAGAGGAGGAAYNPDAFSFMREAWLEKKMRERTDDYTEDRKLNIYCASYNVNAKKPAEDLSPWLVSDESVDIYAIGFQEIVDLNAVNLLADHAANKPWEALIEKTLKGQYELCRSVNLVGLSLMVYVRKALMASVRDVDTHTVGVGVLGVGGNKGAVAIRLRVYDSTICFVNSHLAAHKNNVQGRNSDYHNVCKRLSFTPPPGRRNLDGSSGGDGGSGDGGGGGGSGGGDGDGGSGGAGDSGSTPRHLRRNLGLFDHDLVFWIGDLNYRLNLQSLEEVYQRIEVEDWEYLLKHDQLLTEKGEGAAFEHFHEAKIDFAPTYKYQPGTHLYERREDKKKRFPAWCDRLQFYKGKGMKDGVRQLFYRRAELLCSDHKPVMALYEVRAKMIDPTKERDVYQSLTRQLDQKENEIIPRVRMSRNAIFFSQTSFDTPSNHTLTIENVGQSMVRFTFVPKLQEEHYCKRWLRVEPEWGIIPPTESLEIKLQVHVTRETAERLNTGEDMLEDILIVRLENGRDYFVTISGDYLKSSFGSSIEYLVKTPMPVRMAPAPADGSGSRKKKSGRSGGAGGGSSAAAAAAAAAGGAAARVLSVPKELWRIVDFIYRRGMDEEGIFVTSGNAKQVERVRECLDTGQDFGNFDVHSMAEALIRFLSSLAHPVFPRSLCAQFHESMNLTAWCKQALMKLSAAHYNAFIYLTSFLREVLAHAPKNKLAVDQLVIVFATALMHDDAVHGYAKSQQPKSWTILRHFLTSDDFV